VADIRQPAVLPSAKIIGLPKRPVLYGDLFFTVAATFKSRQPQSKDCGYGFIENALNARSVEEWALKTNAPAGFPTGA